MHVMHSNGLYIRHSLIVLLEELVICPEFVHELCPVLRLQRSEVVGILEGGREGGKESDRVQIGEQPDWATLTVYSSSHFGLLVRFASLMLR